MPIELEITLRRSSMIMDFEGTQPWGYHSMNCTPAGMDGGMFVTLTQHMNFEGLVNDGAWMATELKLPHGTWTNPDNELVATATSMGAAFARLRGVPAAPVARLPGARLCRGGVSSARSIQPDDRDGRHLASMAGLFGMAHFECAAAGSGALAIKDGLDTAYVGWNPESDMGNIEIWEQNMPMVYIGRSIVPDSGGAGKYRGGCAFDVDLAFEQDRPSAPGDLRAFQPGLRQRRACAAAIRRRPARNTAPCATPNLCRNWPIEAQRRPGALRRAPTRIIPRWSCAAEGDHVRPGRGALTSPRRTRTGDIFSPLLQWRRRLPATCWSAMPVKTALGRGERPS
jgi:hypothetical protein